MTERTTKRCARCRETKPVAEFGPFVRRPHRGGYFRAYCKSCHNERRRVENPMPRADRGKFVRAKKACATCGALKALVAYTGGSEVCRACTVDKPERTIHPTAYQLSIRHSFADWTREFACTEAEHATIRTALARYGRSGTPSADTIIEEFCGPEKYVEGGPHRRASVLRHAVVLLANELAKGQGRRGPNKRRPPTYRAAELGRTDQEIAA